MEFKCIFFRKLLRAYAFYSIRHLHFFHNAPYLPPKIWHKYCFNFSWDGCNTQEKWKTKVMQNVEGQIRCIIGDVQAADAGKESAP